MSIFQSKKHWQIIATLSILFLYMTVGTGCSKDTTATVTPTGINKVNHVIVIYMENHSFDNLYGEYMGANGLSNATAAQWTQVDTAAGNPVFATLPWNDPNVTPAPKIANKFFNIDSLRAISLTTEDLVHRYYQEQFQIDGGKMDKFAAISTAKGLSMGFYHTAELPMVTSGLIAQSTLCDNFFHSAFGGSFMNHIFLISAQVATWPGAPTNTLSVLDSKGYPSGKGNDNNCTPDNYVINTSFSVNDPHPAGVTALVPNQNFKTIGDELSAANVSWAWYTGKWNAIVAGTASHADSSLFQFHHQPFIYFTNYANGTAAKAAHLKDETDMDAAIANGTLPAVSFWKPYGADNEHPGYTDVITGENYLVNKLKTIQASPIWKDCVIIITYDEHGGFWDHVNPPKIDKWGPGLRVPGIILSPFSVKGIDHTQYETVSILSFIEKRWGLAPLGTRDAAADPFSKALSF